MSKVVSGPLGESSANLDASNPVEIRSFLLTQLEKIDKGQVNGFSAKDLSALRREISVRLMSLDQGLSEVQSNSRAEDIDGATKDVIESDDGYTIPRNSRGNRSYPAVTFSRRTGQIMEGYLPRNVWFAYHRVSACVLAVLIEHSVEGGSSFLNVNKIADLTGYSVSTIKTEFCVLRSMRGVQIEKGRGAQYRVASFQND